MSAWRWPHLILLWVLVFITASLLTWFVLTRRGNFAYLVPYPVGFRATWRFVRSLFATFPFAATGWLALPCVALVLTIWWFMTHRGGMPRPSI